MPELGRKITCAECGGKFYDMGKSDPVCPKCGQAAEVVDAGAALKRGSTKAPSRPATPAVAEADKNKEDKSDDLDLDEVESDDSDDSD